jgi:hypothetical protein
MLGPLSTMLLFLLTTSGNTCIQKEHRMPRCINPNPNPNDIEVSILQLSIE